MCPYQGTGTWGFVRRSSVGPMAGKNVVHDVSFQWVLGGEYV
jgi:hypothetical protein